MQVEGHLAIADYHRKDGKLFITHVEVPSALRGKGVAAQLMQGVVEHVKNQGLTLVPICSYAVAYMQRHSDKN